MATALQILNRAFSKAGIKSAEVALTATESQDGLDILNDLLASWSATGVLNDTAPVADINDTVVAPDYALGALKANVAVLLAGEYGVIVTPAMAADVTFFTNLMSTMETDLSDVPFPPTLPTGSGNDDYYYTPIFFPDIAD